MKTTRSSRSAWVNFRVLIALTLCLAGLSLTVTALGAWSGLSAAGWVNSIGKINNEARLKIKMRKSAGD